MDVATLNKEYAETNNSPKGNTPNAGSAESAISNFSAAVAERMKLIPHADMGEGKNGLSGILSANKSDDVLTGRASHDTSSADPVDDNRDTAAQTRTDTAAPEDRELAAHGDDYTPTDSNFYDDASHDQHGDGFERKSSDTDGSEKPQDNTASTSDDGTSDAPQEAAQNDGDAPAVDTAANGPKAEAQPQDGLDVAGQTLAAVASTLETTKVNTANPAGGSQNAAKGLETAKAAVVGPATNVGDGEAEGEGAQTKDKGKSTTAQAQNTPNTHLKTQGADGAEKVATAAQQQAADLAKKIGPNQGLNVSVNVTKAADQLTSQPAAALLAQGTAKTEGESLTPTTTPAATNGKGQAVASVAQNLGGQAGQSGGDAQAQNQQQSQLQMANAEAAKSLANAADAKAAQSNTAVQGAKASGGEGTTTATQSTSSANAGLSTTAPAPQQAATQAKAQANPHAQARAQVTEQVTVQINKAIKDGADQIRIHLKPAHLGRIDVQLEVNSDGRVTAVISADNKDTLDLLKQDSRELERAMREAGLNLGSSDLSFNMRGQGGQDGPDGEQAKSNTANQIQEPTLDELLDAQANHAGIISENRVDITA